MCLACLPALGQSALPEATSPPGAQNAEINYIRNLEPGHFRGTDLLGKNVKNTEGEEIGTVSDVLFDLRGALTGIVIDVGGFLGIGEAEIAVPFDALRFARTDTETSVTSPRKEAGDLTASDTPAERTTSEETLTMDVFLATSRENLEKAPRFDDSTGQ